MEFHGIIALLKGSMVKMMFIIETQQSKSTY